MSAKGKEVVVGGPAGVSHPAQPREIAKVAGHADQINAIYVVPPPGSALITASDDCTLRIWSQRDNGSYLPSVCEAYQCGVSALHFILASRTLTVGLDDGRVVMLEVSEDYNKVKPTLEIKPHAERVTGVHFDPRLQVVISVSRDCALALYNTQGERLGRHAFKAWCSALAYDPDTRHIFVGDYSGVIHFMSWSMEGQITEVSALEGHAGSVRCLEWAVRKQVLYSGGFDNAAIVWYIGDRKGICHELNAHTGKIKALCYLPASEELVSTGDDSSFVIWDLEAPREATPEWQESDVCQQCDAPFFWNQKVKFNVNRQHHCRKCGLALCASCCSKTSAIPLLGHENAVRVCKVCFDGIENQQLEPRMRRFKAPGSVVCMHYDESSDLLATALRNKEIRLWTLRK